MHVFRKEWKQQFYWLPPVNITVQISPTCSDQFKLSLDSAEAGEGITLGILCLVWHKMQCYKHINRITDTISIICSFFWKTKGNSEVSPLYCEFLSSSQGQFSGSWFSCWWSRGITGEVHKSEKYNMLFPKRNISNQKLKEILGLLL